MTGSNPKLSIITIVFNNVKDIERTMLSVINQTYRNIEYIIVDGLSTDGTLDIIEQYRHKIAVLISEKDKGIYDAMNKGLAAATGDYVLFMNSGDEIYDLDTVSKIFLAYADADIYYGETEMIDGTGASLGARRHKVPKELKLSSFKFGMSVSHQAIYIKKSITEKYDEAYQLSADIDWILKAVSKAKKIVNVKFFVAKYLVGGMSKQKHLASLKERYQIFNKYYGVLPNLFNHFIIAFNLGFYWLKYRKTND